MEVRDRVAREQEKVIALFKCKIQQGCTGSIAVLSYFLGQSLEWVSFKSPSLLELLFETLEILVQYPIEPLMSIVLANMNRCFETKSESSVAAACLPKLLQIIQSLPKSKLTSVADQPDEGVDHSNTRHWESAHPYPKTDNS
jgi:hypothetical protein